MGREARRSIWEDASNSFDPSQAEPARLEARWAEPVENGSTFFCGAPDSSSKYGTAILEQLLQQSKSQKQYETIPAPLKGWLMDGKYMVRGVSKPFEVGDPSSVLF